MRLKSFTFSVVALACAMVSTISLARDIVMYQQITDNKPDIGVSTTVYLGDRMLQQRRGQYQECIVPKFDYQKSMYLGIGTFVVKAGQPICKKEPDSKNYTPNYVNWLGGTDAQLTYDVALKQENGGLLNICLSSGGVKSGCTKDKNPSDYESEPYFLYNVNSLQQTIEYAGRSGAVLKFIYSEFQDGFARQAFTREFQSDLNEGNIAAYKGAVIEIESATNASITYKVVRNFQQ